MKQKLINLVGGQLKKRKGKGHFDLYTNNTRTDKSVRGGHATESWASVVIVTTLVQNSTV